MKIKEVLKKMIFGYKSSSEEYIKYIRSKGAKIGENCHIFCPKDTSIDTSNLYLLEIGNNVKITGPTTILMHDYSTCVINKIDKRIYGKQRKVRIGNNIFLGWGCTILCGTEIGDNTIIGAGAVVNGKLEGNSVYAGNPAKKICTIEEYKNKINEKQLEDAKKIYTEYKRRFGIIPPIEIFHEYFYLFTKSDKELLGIFRTKVLEEKIEFKNEKPLFESYKKFCEYCENKGE
mgnify:FL=1